MPNILDLPGFLIFQLDGAPSHWVIDVRSYLDTKLPYRGIGRRGPIGWLARAPDFNPSEFFMSNLVENNHFSVQEQSLRHMKEIAEQYIAAVSTKTSGNVEK